MLKRPAAITALGFWFALEMHHRSALGAKLAFARNYYVAFTNLTYSTRELHSVTLQRSNSTRHAGQAKSVCVSISITTSAIGQTGTVIPASIAGVARKAE